MLGRFVRVIILIPLAVVLVAFAVANRQTVIVSFDPFDAVAPAYAVAMPLFLLIIAMLIIGVVIGGTAAWLRQNKWRRAARRHESEVRRLQAENDRLRQRFDSPAERPVGQPYLPRLTIPPAA